jgi:hypothetical protein
MSSDDTIKVFRTGQVGSLCTVRVSETSTALKGELDVFIQAAEGTFFERITAQRPDIFVDYKNPSEINACTWHGNYVNSGDGIAGPKIHLKKDNKKVSWTSLDGVIEQKSIFMFPVFSLHIPHTFSAKPRNHRGSRGAAQTLSLKEKDVRIDFQPTGNNGGHYPRGLQRMLYSTARRLNSSLSRRLQYAIMKDFTQAYRKKPGAPHRRERAPASR